MPVHGTGHWLPLSTTGRRLFLRAVVTPILFLDPPSDDFWNLDPAIYAGGNISIGYTFMGKRK